MTRKTMTGLETRHPERPEVDRASAVCGARVLDGQQAATWLL